MYKVPLMRPSLPAKSEFLKIIDELWETRQLSNFGKYSELMETYSKEIFESNRIFRTVVSCDVGLTLALKSFCFEKNSEVIVQSFTFNSTPNTILWNELTPVFVDIDKENLCIDFNDLRKKINKKTAAIVVTHIFGNTADLNELESIAKENNLKLIFDAAHAYGSMFAGKHVCEYGDASVYSFSGTKLVTSAEGGLACFKDQSVADNFSKLRNYGFLNDYNTKMLGMNGKISEIHAGLAYLAMQDLDKVMHRRQQIANQYISAIGNIAKFQHISDKNVSTYKDFAILTENRNFVYERLMENGIQVKKYFFPMHKTDFFKNKNVTLPNTDYVYDRIICLPIFNDITDSQVEYVINNVTKSIKMI